MAMLSLSLSKLFKVPMLGRMGVVTETQGVFWMSRLNSHVEAISPHVTVWRWGLWEVIRVV
jgi:hypothetical protein